MILYQINDKTVDSDICDEILKYRNLKEKEENENVICFGKETILIYMYLALA